MIKTFVEDYENLTDNQLVELINNGRYEFLQLVIDRYFSVINFYVNKYCTSFDKEDAVQEAIFALYSAVKNFNAEKSSFSTFASLCIKRSVFDALKNDNRKKKIPTEMLSSIDNIDIADSNSPEKIFFDRENFKSLTDTIKLELSSLEFCVLQYYLKGDKYSVIADKLSISVKSVDNSLKRIRIKLKNIKR